MSHSDRVAKVTAWLIAAGADYVRPSPEGVDVRCFFHESRHRSRGYTLNVNVKKGVFCCQSGVCGRAGPISVILMERLGYSQQKAIRIQQDFASAEIPDLEKLALPAWEQRHVKAEETKRVETINPEILGAYNRCPKYMLNRGFEKDTLRSWEVGFDRDAMRVTIPVRDATGRLVGVTKRAIDDSDHERYKHLYFDRAKTIFGAYRADSPKSHEPLKVVESQMSAMWAYQYDVPNVVATLGAKVSKDQMAWIARYSRVILAFDGDTAGRAATYKIGHYLSQKLAIGAIEVACDYPTVERVDEEGEVIEVPVKDPQEIVDPTLLRGFFRSTIGYEGWLVENDEFVVALRNRRWSKL